VIWDGSKFRRSRQSKVPSLQEQPLNPDELAGRIMVLEVISMTTLGWHLANSANDPDFSKAGALFASLRLAISDRALALPEAQQAEAVAYADELLSRAFENLKNLEVK
jgi:hypothetical protein